MKKFILALGLLGSIVHASYISSGGGAALSGGTTNRITKWNSSSDLTNSSWSEDSSGRLSNNSSTKGTVSNLMINMGLGNSVQSGFFLDASFNRVCAATDSTLVTSFGASPEMFVHGSTSTDTVSHRLLGQQYTLKATGGTSPFDLGFVPRSGTTEAAFYIYDGSSVQTLGFQTTTPANTTTPRHIYFTGKGSRTDGPTGDIGDQLDFINVTRGGGIGIGGADNISKLNTFTIKPRNDWTIGGTTSSASGTTITGTSTIFTEDLGVYDEIATSNAASTFATITAIASDTSLTVSSNLGDGTSRNIVRRQAPLRILDRSGTTQIVVSPAGKLGMRSGSNATVGTATCNGTTEVTVSTTQVTDNSLIFLTAQAPNGTPGGVAYVSSRSAGTSFGFKCAVADTSTMGWMIVEKL